MSPRRHEQDTVALAGATFWWMAYLKKRFSMRLNRYGEAWEDFARRCRPHLEINGDLANSIHQMHPGYTGRLGLQMPPEHIDLLEAMDLRTWSVLEGTIYALTVPGRQCTKHCAMEVTPRLTLCSMNQLWRRWPCC